MEIIRYVLGPVATNAFILVADNGKDALVIDPGAPSPEFLNTIKKYSVQLIVNTHGHFDHIGGNTAVQNQTGAKIAVHALDAVMLTNPVLNLSSFFGSDFTSPVPDIILSDTNNSITLDNMNFEVLHVPGHTPGSVALFEKNRKILIAGDFIFSNSIGRTDFKGGDQGQMKESILRIVHYPNDLQVYSGHGESFLLSDFKRIYRYFIDGDSE